MATQQKSRLISGLQDAARCVSAVLPALDPEHPIRTPAESLAAHARQAAAVLSETVSLPGDDGVTELVYRSLFETSSEPMYALNRYGRFLSVNPAFSRLTGYSAVELVGAEFLVLLPAKTQVEAGRFFAEPLRSKAQFMDAALTRQDGLQITVDLVLAPILVDGETVGICGVARDVSAKSRAEEELAHLSLHDPLTGLANRTLFAARLEQALKLSVRDQPSMALLYLDLDDFKIVNDSLGHRAGDALLVEAARRLQSCIAPQDTVARLGGDEFTVLLARTDDTVDAIRVAEKILMVLAAPFQVDGHEMVVTPSVGVVMGNQGQDAKELLRYADIAMYQAKRNGKARYEAFTPVMYAQVLQRVQLEADLRRAIDRQEFEVWYQPVTCLYSGAVTGVEALIRWRHPERGLIGPSEFIPLAEETGLIVPIGRWVLEEACEQVEAWTRRWPDLAVNVNLSARQFQDPMLAAQVAAVLQQTGLPPESLVLEITETALMQDEELTRIVVQELKGLGIKLAMDDFGTGYSSLGYLRRFPMDILKIDRSFVEGLGQKAEDAALVNTVIQLAKVLKLTVTGEGIEGREQLAELQAMGCDRGQGFYFARPLPASEMEAVFAGGFRSMV